MGKGKNPPIVRGHYSIVGQFSRRGGARPRVVSFGLVLEARLSLLAAYHGADLCLLDCPAKRKEVVVMVTCSYLLKMQRRFFPRYLNSDRAQRCVVVLVHR